MTITELIKSTELDKYDVSSVETIISASTPIRAEKVDAVKQRMPYLRNIYQMYGISEACCPCTEMYAKFGPRSGSVGPPSPGFVFKVVDIDTQEILGANKRGEIRFKSPSLTPGYLHIENRDYMDSEGFFKTGDVGHYDEDGYFYIINRIKELIKHNDISIPPAELEGILEQHPQIVEAGVTGVNEGKTLAALVVTQHPHPTEGEVMQYINSRITFRMHVNAVHRVDKLPRGAGGKLDRNTLNTQAIKFYNI